MDVGALERDGFTVVRGAIGEPWISSLRTEIERLWRNKIAAAAEERGEQSSFTQALRDQPELQHLHRESPLLLGVLLGEPHAGLVAELLGPDVDLFWEQAYLKPAGSDAVVPWHQDTSFAPESAVPLRNLWLALTPTREENGAVRFLAGSHREGGRPHRWNDASHFNECDAGPEEIARARCPALEPGDLLIFDARCVHQSGGNRTGAMRLGLSASFAPAAARLPSGVPAGLQVPVVRRGVPVAAALREASAAALGLRADATLARAGAHVLEELGARPGVDRVALRQAAAALASAARDGDEAAALEHLHALLTGPREVAVLGELLSARVDAVAVVREVRSNWSSAPASALGKLLERALALSPGDPEALELRAQLPPTPRAIDGH